MNQELGIMKGEAKRIKSFTDLDAWQEGHKLVLMVYEATKNFPLGEQFGLTSQIRRAVISITSNVAEGFSRYSYKEKSQFYSIALGSVTETQNQLLIARDVKYLPVSMFQGIAEQSVKVSKIVNGLIKKSRLTHDS